ncbi:MAG: hypothetical protein MUE50_04095, partial [Pirellulaceae bacterium]|nr:hypothetical protein [Pirellulaceae bacterium]
MAKTPDDALASLAKQIDKLVADNQEKKLAAVINFTGEPTDDYKAKIAEFGTKHNLKNVALTVTADADRFKINDQAPSRAFSRERKRSSINGTQPKSLRHPARPAHWRRACYVSPSWSPAFRLSGQPKGWTPTGPDSLKAGLQQA